MTEPIYDPTPPQGRPTRRTAPGSGLALCGFGIRSTGRPRPYPAARGRCPVESAPPRPEDDA
ncbi:hypothetical protein ACFO5K_03530 [Nocardia halotolerans]|uniref:Uncharacterized protein n=1 Tax=Nocardia halotolerans TaxID=1755878 RepID=A0ABV8VCW8_9NOCA